jgi:hypothetical protein
LIKLDYNFTFGEIEGHHNGFSAEGETGNGGNWKASRDPGSEGSKESS